MTTAIRKPAALTAALITAVATIVAALTHTVRAQDRRKDADAQRITDATAVFSEVMSLEDKAIPRAVLERAEGVAIFPRMPRMTRRRGQGPNTLKTARLLEVSGRGILSVRGESPTWSTPLFLTLSDVTLPQDADVVIVIVNRRGLENLTKHEFAIDAEAAVAPGPIGRDPQAWTDLERQAEIFSYSRSRGVVEGISLTGGTVQRDTFANQRFYGKPWMTAGTIAEPRDPAPVAAWRGELEKHATR
jgi:lipid-binding SYLF domain-containing protein